MKKLNIWQLLLLTFLPTAVLSGVYYIVGHFVEIPFLLLFCILGTALLVPMELGAILRASKQEFGEYCLKSAFCQQEKMSLWQTLFIAALFFGIAGLLSAFVAPLENRLWAGVRTNLLDALPAGFDWTDYGYLRSFSKPVLVISCAYYAVFNGLLGPITEELFFRGYLTSHYEKQNGFTPVLIAILFSLYHFWLPFNNGFRILAFGPVAYVAYRKKNIYISVFFHCLCNLFSAVSFILEVWG